MGVEANDQKCDLVQNFVAEQQDRAKEQAKEGPTTDKIRKLVNKRLPDADEEIKKGAYQPVQQFKKEVTVRGEGHYLGADKDLVQSTPVKLTFEGAVNCEQSSKNCKIGFW